MPKKNLKPKRKRVNGEGTFYQREDKSWVHQVTLGRKTDGTPNRKAFTGATQAECLEKKQAYLKRMESEEARRDGKKGGLSAKTIRNHHMLLVEGDVPLPIIKDILGHASIQTTQLYTHTDVEKEREAITGMTNYLNLDLLKDAAPLRGAKKRMKFASLNLPDFSNAPKAAD